MDAHKLVKMANEVAVFFEQEADAQVALAGIADHLKRFWDPRMRRAIVRLVDENAGAGLRPAVVQAIAAHRGKLLPIS